MTDSPLGRLRRLPRWIAAGTSAIVAVGLLVPAVLLIRADTARRELLMDADLRRVTSSVVRLVSYDGAVNTVRAGEDELNGRCPEFAILSGRTEPFSGFASRRDCAPVDPAVLADLAVRAVDAGELLTWYVEGPDGRRARVAAEPFRKQQGQFVGAVVAATDAGDADAAHLRYVVSVAGGCLFLLILVAAGGHLLARRAIRPAAAALEQQETLLADTAHDLRTPVAALRALAESALLNPEQRPELLPRTVELAQRMGTIIDGVLIQARIAAGVDAVSREPVWLDQLVGTLVEETPAEGARVTVTTAPTRVDADPALVRRAIGNLLDNALRHGRTPGRDAEVHITVAGGRVIVADHGPGIDPALAAATFDRFHSTGGSSGLGLSIVRWVARAHGGTLRVYNADEGGAIFELVLPEER